MNPEEAFEFVNRLFVEKTQTSLSKLEQDIFVASYENLSYRKMVGKIAYDEQYIRGTASKLFKKITDIFGININKKNLQPAIEQLWKQHSEKSQISQRTLTELTNPAVEDILPPASPSQPQANLIAENMLSNPFIPRNSIIDDPGQFFNRHREIKKVFEHLNSNSSVALIGEEGIGKSSLLGEICRQSEYRLSLPRKPVYIELLDGVNNDDLFYIALCDKIDIPESKGYLLTRVLRQHPNRFLLALDNAGKMTREGFTRNLREHLQGLSQGSDAPLRLILAVGEPLDQLFKDNQNESKTSPFHGLFQQEYIKPWDEVTVREFIKSRLETTSVRFTEEEITQLVQKSAGHPRRLMQLCYKTYARYMEQVQ
ncbi:ATP-binding protein [Microcoleus sp. FACHB-672]|uniref:ATP-binding protein n=1 Tax=Microcoleus sp. FACHB-672 TaxID=2692825 RepID=UPI0016889B68|nr:ATP-binding protein [Microcoleus sp. FACHB-672]MBD2043160.1 ATP-binding protein [Microcoleus sp. FACHB-672]